MIDRSPGADNIIGLDPFNEPYAGTHSPCVVFTPCPTFESGALASFYGRVIQEIRTTGDTHVIFPEGIAQNGLAQPSLPQFADGQTAFSFHYYCTFTQTSTSNNPYDQACGPHRNYGVGSFVSYANSLNVPAFEGEFSCNDADDDNAPTVDLFDQDLLSWTIWAYYAYAQDPANCSGQGLLVDDTKPGSEANAKQAKLDAIVVPYAEAIAGTPQSYAFDRSTKTMTLSYVAQAVPGATLDPGAATEIFVPARKYPQGYSASVAGGHVTSEPGAAWLEVRADHPGAAVTVTLAPAS
jgi:endoglycosylceramidase